MLNVAKDTRNGEDEHTEKRTEKKNSKHSKSFKTGNWVQTQREKKKFWQKKNTDGLVEWTRQ